MKELIFKKRKRDFIKMYNYVIDKKISLECLLNSYSEIEKLKIILLNKKQKDILFRLPNFSLEKHVNEIINKGK